MTERNIEICSENNDEYENGDDMENVIITRCSNGLLRSFIKCYEQLPELWDEKHPHYMDRNKRQKGLDRLLRIMRKWNPQATREDVRKKINTLRSNFRKELRKIRESQASASIDGTQIYKPTTWSFYELKFLMKREESQLDAVIPINKIEMITIEKNDQTEDESNIDTIEWNTSFEAPKTLSIPIVIAKSKEKQKLTSSGGRNNNNSNNNNNKPQNKIMKRKLCYNYGDNDVDHDHDYVEDHHISEEQLEDVYMEEESPKLQPAKIQRPSHSTVTPIAATSVAVSEEGEDGENKNEHNTKRERDEFDAFGEHIAWKLRKIKNPLIQCQVQRNIDNVLYDGLIEYLSATSLT